jgi:uncharacterized membrane protein
MIGESSILKQGILKTLPLFLLLSASFFSPHASLVSTLIFTLFVPGYIIVEYYFKDLNIHEKLLLYMLLSVLISTHFIYFLSLAFGYSQHTILTAFFILFALLFLFFLRNTETAPKRSILHLSSLKGVMLSSGIAFFAYLVLSKSVWVWRQGYIVLTGSNWQDTPMHYEIIESINNGNFPPQMPYYAGVDMFYHYFVDFHTAILEKAFGAFLPRLIVFTNAIFVFLFALSLYVLASYLKNEKAGVYAVLLGTLGAGFSYSLFFSALYTGQFELTTNYAFEYGKFFTIPPIFDNLLQQRPQLMGLPMLTTSAYFFYKGSRSFSYSREGKREIALAGLLAGLLFPFHMLACFSAFLLFVLNFLKNRLSTRSESTRNYELYFLVFFVPLILPYLIQMFAGSSGGLIEPKLPWAFYFVKSEPFVFYLANLGLPFLLALACLFKKSVHPHSFFVYSWLFLMLALPNFVSFTPNVWDMYKFFHYAWIAIAVAGGCFLADITFTNISKSSRLRRGLVATTITLLLVFSVFTSGLVAMWNISTNYSCADIGEYETGLWVRENTPERAVFLTWCSIHAPVSMIGGRLRVLGYVNWAYGHGFDIWERAEDIERAYKGNVSETLNVLQKYDASYVYVGKEEQKNAPECLKKFEDCKQLEKVYEDPSGENHIFKPSFKKERYGQQ